jgi:hypothetical protein
MCGRKVGATEVEEGSVVEEDVEDMVFDEMFVRKKKETKVSLMALIPCKIK